jgi:hypothetical protein
LWQLGLTAVGAIYATGRRREFWLGAIFFGAGFLIMVFSHTVFDSPDPEAFVPTVRMLEAIRPSLDDLMAGHSGDPDSAAVKNARINKLLMQPTSFQIPDETTLEGLLTYLRNKTKGPQASVVPIHADPIGLKEAEKSMDSQVTAVKLEGVALRTSLELCLKPLDLAFVVRDGMLLITSTESSGGSFTSAYDDPYQVVGHCLLALIAALVGGFAAPLVCDLTRWRPSLIR